jgi:hypothetical protein
MDETKWTLRHEPDVVVVGSREEMKGGRPHVLAKFEKPTEGRFGNTWIPKDQLKEVVGVLKKMESKASSSASKAGKNLRGKLGMYGAIKGALEGAKTLRKLKTGAYDLTPTGEPVLKKGLIES